MDLPLTFTFDRTVRTVVRHGGARIESARISGTIDGPEAKAVFQARRVLKMGSDGSETQVGLSYQYRIPGHGSSDR